jgi:hypothetical protein
MRWSSNPRSKQFLLAPDLRPGHPGIRPQAGDAPYNDARDIVADAERLGLALDRGTIARYLKEARQQAESFSGTD